MVVWACTLYSLLVETEAELSNCYTCDIVAVKDELTMTAMWVTPCYQSSFQLSVESRITLVVLFFALWLVQKTLATLLTNQFKTKTNHDLVARVFLRFRQFVCLYFEFSLALRVIFISSDWSLRLLWFLFYDTRSKPSNIVINFYFYFSNIYIEIKMCLVFNPSSCMESIWYQRNHGLILLSTAGSKICSQVFVCSVRIKTRTVVWVLQISFTSAYSQIQRYSKSMKY